MASVYRAFAAAWLALRFWVVNFPALVRLTWFPFALLGLVAYAWKYTNAPTNAPIPMEAEGQPSTSVALLPPFETIDGTLLWAVLQLIALSSAAAAVHRLVIAGERQRGEFFAFAFGNAERGYFAMGVVAYALMTALLVGQHFAQFAMPFFDDSLVMNVVKPYGELGPFVLMMFIWPGELGIFSMPPENYALWCAVVIATGAVLIRLAPWPATVAAERSFALAPTLALTRGQTLPVLVFFASLALAAAVIATILAFAGALSLVAAGPDQLGAMLKNMVSGGTHGGDIDVVAAEQALALYQEIARFIANVLGITLGATLLSHLYLALRGEPAKT